MGKPSLHEIAAMPFPASMLTMRKHYNRDWHKPEPDGEVRTWKVKVNYSVRTEETKTYEVEAVTEEEANELAEDMFDKDKAIPADVEVDDVIAELVA
ncbi:hypothetical protein [uncultured Sphingomonas sp.]|uniref:hypothetical protein n=1 Tax=uncultured Sphingomonas sp. TaxID=158754 RepID=UPI003748BA59